jgi:iron complex outermembrane receptor protein
MAQHRDIARTELHQGWHRGRSRRVSALLLSTVIAAVATPVSAQTASAPAPGADRNDGVPELVVTATRREEKLSRIPVSVTAFTSENLDRLGIKQIEDVVQQTPSLQFSKAAGYTAGFSNSISIRGVSSLVGAATTGVYIDDTPVQVRTLLIVSGNNYPKVFDLDRVEVLRGPQGTLFGAGSEGGALRFITAQPNFSKFSGTARAELGFTKGGSPSYEGGLAMGGPLVDDKLAARASVWYRRDGGWIDRVNGNNGDVLHHNGNTEESFAGKFALSWKVTPTLTLTPSVFYQRIHDDERTQYRESLSSPGNYRSASFIPEPLTDKFVLPALRAQFEGNGFSVISNTSYFKRDYISTFDYTDYLLAAIGHPDLPVPAGLPGGEDQSISQIRQRNFTQELRVQSAAGSRLQWVVGAFYTDNKQDGQQNIPALASDEILRRTLGVGWTGILGRPFVDGNQVFQTLLRSTERQEALFADVTYSITDKLKFNAGVRFAHTSFSYDQVSAGPLVAAVPQLSGGKQSEKPITPKFGLSYQIDPNNFVYFSAAKGFRIGGAQPQLIDRCNPELASIGYSKSPTSYQSDSLWSYEVGSKNSFFGGRVRVAGSLYYIDWKNIQSRVALLSCGGSVIIANLGSATSKGGDLSVQAKLFQDLMLSAAVGYNDTTYNQTIASSSGAIFSKKGQVIGGAPFNMSVSGQYDFRGFADLPMYVRADFQHQSAGPAPDPLVFGYDAAIPRMPSTNNLNLRAGVTFKRWDISAFVKNATNAHPALFRAHKTNSLIFYNTTVTPLNGGITAILKF